MRVCGAPAFTLMYWLRKRRKEVEHSGAIAASTILYAITESCRCRDIESLRLPACRVHKVPSMTNCQVKHVTPEAWAKKVSVLCNGNRCMARIISVRVAAIRRLA